jgi:hypothetical protein
MLDDRVGVLSAQIHALSAELVDTLAQLDDADGWAGPGFRSYGHWLSVRAGFVPREAERLTSLAQRLDRVPTLMKFARAGQVSIGMCETAARVSTSENEAAIADIVRTATPSQAARVLAQYRRLKPAPEPDPSDEIAPDDIDDAPDPGSEEPPRADDLNDGEWWSAFFDDNGMYRGSFCLNPVTGELLRQALDGARRAGERDRNRQAADDRSPRDRSPIPAPEAIERLAALALDNINAHDITAPGGERYAVQINIDIEVLARILGTTLNDTIPTRIRLGERCHIVGGPTLTDAELSTILCDASLQVLIHDNGVPLWLGAEQRTASRHLRRALKFRDGGCGLPGCRQTHFVDAHHVTYFTNGGPTNPDNCILLCGFHHRQLHRGEFTITALGKQHFEFRDKWGRIIGKAHDPKTEGTKPPEPLQLLPHVRDDIGPNTPRPLASGEPLTEYGLDVLLHGLLSVA